MDSDLINLLKNSIENDHCKLICLLSMKQNSKNYFLDDLIIFSILYDMDYFVEKLYAFKNSKWFEDEVDFAYLYYRKKNEKEKTEEKRKIMLKYNNEKNKKKKLKEISKLDMINFYRKSIKKYRNTETNNDFRNNNIICERLNIIALAMKYKFLLDEYKLKNDKIDRILNWNIKRVKKCNRIENRILLFG